MHVVRGEVRVELLMSYSIINLRVPSKSHKDKSRFCVSKILYQTQDMERNTTQEKQRIEQFDHIIHINTMTYSRLCGQHDDCS